MLSPGQCRYWLEGTLMKATTRSGACADKPVDRLATLDNRHAIALLMA